MNRNPATRAIVMISVLSFVIAMPFVTTASALLTFTTGYSSPPDYPVTSNVQISPAHPVVGDEISCSYDFYDQSGDADHSTISWQLINTTGGYFIANGSSIDTSNFEKNSVIECYVVAFDGTDYGNTDRTQIMLGENISRSVPDMVPSIVYMRDNQSAMTDITYEGEIIEMSHKEHFEWNISLMRLNLNEDFRIFSYLSNDTTGIISLTSHYITASSHNMTISLGKLSFEYANACYVATIMIQQLQRSSIYTDSFNFVINAGGNDCEPYEQQGKYNPDCVTCPKAKWAYIYTTNTMKQNVEVKTTGLYPGKGYTLDVVLINETTPSIVFSESHEWNATHGAKVFVNYGHELAVGDYCVIATLYEDGEWINTVRTCQTIEEPEPPRIHYTSIRYNDYHMNHYVETWVVNMVFGKNYTLEVQLVNNTTGDVIISENDTINASFLNWNYHTQSVSLEVGLYCAIAKLYENGVFIDEQTRCRYVVENNATIVSNQIGYNDYYMNYNTYSKVSYLKPGVDYRVTMTVSNTATGNNIIAEDHEWTATYGAKTFRIHGLSLPIGEFCLTTVLYENGTEVSRRVNCMSVICQYDTNSMDIGIEAPAESEDESSNLENVFEAIIDAVSEMITEIFAEIRTEDSDTSQNDSDNENDEQSND
ncbi:MAG: hypothetical protein ACPH4H_01650 [Candidatus Poseidoniaceae archaeon]